MNPHDPTAGMTAAQKQAFQTAAASTVMLLAYLDEETPEGIPASEEAALGAMQGILYVAGSCVGGAATKPATAALLMETFNTAAGDPTIFQHGIDASCLKAAS